MKKSQIINILFFAIPTIFAFLSALACSYTLYHKVLIAVFAGLSFFLWVCFITKYADEENRKKDKISDKMFAIFYTISYPIIYFLLYDPIGNNFDGSGKEIVGHGATAFASLLVAMIIAGILSFFVRIFEKE